MYIILINVSSTRIYSETPSTVECQVLLDSSRVANDFLFAVPFPLSFPVLVLPEKTYLFALINPLLAKLVLPRLLDIGLIPSGKAAQKDSSLFLITGGVT